MAKAKDKETVDKEAVAEVASIPSVGDVALRLLQTDSQIFVNYEHKWVAARVKTLAQFIIDEAGEFALDIAGLLAPRIYVFSTSVGGEAAFKQSIDNMLEVVMIVRESVEKAVAVEEPAKEPLPPTSDTGAATTTTGGDTSGQSSTQAPPTPQA